MVESSSKKEITVIIVSYNVKDFLCLCLDAVYNAIGEFDAEVIVVDNNSIDDSCEAVKEHFKDAVLIENSKNVGFAKANNQAVAIAKGEIIHFLNPDTVIPEDFYQKGISFLKSKPEIGSIGPRIIDGLGNFAEDSKKSFPYFWVSIYKITGLARIFNKSTKFNRYYAAHIGEHETAEVEILSGCCLLIKKEAMMNSGGSFDESYFMYCEDLDLCHRLKLHGYKNYYYPEITIIHYKGESTRKLTFKYLDIFYNAMSVFVKKYYPKNLGIAYMSSIRLILILRNFFSLIRHLFSLLKLFILDAIIIVLVSFAIKNFWFETIAQRSDFSPAFTKTIPTFTIIWLVSLFLNGAYDKPFSLFKAGRGMVIGTIIVLAWYSLFPLEYRYSRGVVLFSGMTITVTLLFIRILFSNMKLIPLVPRGRIEVKSAVVSSADDYENNIQIIKKYTLRETVLGRISINEEDLNVECLGSKKDILEIQALFELNEIIFISNSLHYKNILEMMEECRGKSFFNIKTKQSPSLIGDHYGKNQLESYSSFQNYAISKPSGKRNKRLLDVSVGLFLAFTYPISQAFVKNKRGLRKNIQQVILGKKTWVGYGNDLEDYAPVLKPIVVPPYKIQENFKPSFPNKIKLAQLYAYYFSVLDDVKYIYINFKYLGN